MPKTHTNTKLNYMTPKQAAEFLNLSLSTIKNYIYSGALKSYKTPGGHHRIKKEDLVKILN
ncbi:MAG: helix-turn-helix domain-containing protein [Candidatus Omnitrophica bacterium]|nr:helix-turn-helix domain-containing protein [Candidatus Omnitrophota bacterium]